MSLTAMWTHGSGIIVESKENLTSERRFGFGTETRLKPGKDCWYHAAIPTPVIVGNKRPKLVRVIILFKSSAGTRLEDVHLFDANQRVRDISEPLAYGDHLTMDRDNTFQARSIEISYALGVSFRFQAPNNEPSDHHEAFIAAVGADFEFPD